MPFNQMLKVCLVALCLFPSASGANPKKVFSDAMFKSMQGFGGIFLSCRQASEVSSVDATICENAIEEFTSRASKHRIKSDYLPFGLPQKERTKELLDRTRKLNSPLGLVIEIHSAKTPEGYVAAVRLSAEVAMGYGVDASVPAGSPSSRPRSGRLHFWDRTAVASGDTAERLSYILGESLKLNMDAFFAEYLKQNR